MMQIAGNLRVILPIIDGCQNLFMVATWCFELFAMSSTILTKHPSGKRVTRLADSRTRVNIKYQVGIENFQVNSL